MLEYGNAVRSKGATGVNPDSSRSHAVLQLEIRDKQDKRLGRFVTILHSWATTRENLSSGFANNKIADQPVQI